MALSETKVPHPPEPATPATAVTTGAKPWAVWEVTPRRLVRVREQLRMPTRSGTLVQAKCWYAAGDRTPEVPMAGLHPTFRTEQKVEALR